MTGPYGCVRIFAYHRRGGALRRPDVRSLNILHQGRPMDGPYGRVKKSLPGRGTRERKGIQLAEGYSLIGHPDLR